MSSRRRTEVADAYLATEEERPRRRTRQTRTAESTASEDDSLLPAINLISQRSHPSRSARDSRSPYKMHGVKQDPNLTPRAPVSGSHRSASRTPRLSVAGLSDRRNVLRKSLAGEHVHEMTLNERATTLNRLAGDCILKLLHVGMAKKPTAQEKVLAARSWQTFHSYRNDSIFPEQAPPFVSYASALTSIHEGPRGRINSNLLRRAVSLSNLATLVWVIMNPDEAANMLITPGADGEQGADRKGKRRAVDSDAELVKHVQRRYRILLLAWKKFWAVIVPPEQKTGEEAMKLWLALGTQILITFQQPTINPESEADVVCPSPTPQQEQELFSTSAMSRFGSWESLEDWPGQNADEMDQLRYDTEAIWQDMARRREATVKSLSHVQLAVKFRYVKFKEQMLAFLNTDILDAEVNSNLPPLPKTEPLNDASDSGSATGQDASDVESESESAIRDDLITDEEDSQPEDTADEGNTGDPADVVDLDFLAMVGQQMELDALTGNPADPSTETEESGWDVRNASSARITSSSTASRFNFTARQIDAQQLDWDSQSPHHNRASRHSMTPHIGHRHIRESVTPRQNQRMSLPPAYQRARLNVQRQTELLQRIDSIATSRAEEPSEDENVGDLPQGIEDLMPDEADQPTDFAAASDDIHTPQFDDLADLLPDEALVPASQQSALGLDLLNRITPAIGNDIHGDNLTPGLSQRVISSGRDRKSANALVFATPDSDEDAEDRNLLRRDRVQTSYNSAVGSVINRASIPPTQAEASHPDLFTLNEYDGELNFSETLASEAATTPRARQGHARPSQATFNPNPPHFDESRTTPRASHPSRVAPTPTQPIQRATPGSQARHASQVMDGPNRPPASPDATQARPRAHYRPTALANADIENDLFVVDADGSPLVVNESYRLPRNYHPQRSRLHGQLDGQATSYSRKSGNLKWTRQLELLTYREIQKVPLTAGNPCAVVWYLHGEFGTLSHALAHYNPQHMKDKMRTTVQRRLNQGLPIVGKARMFLPIDAPQRTDYDRELKDALALANEEAEVAGLADLATQPEEDAEAREAEEAQPAATPKPRKKQAATKAKPKQKQRAKRTSAIPSETRKKAAAAAAQKRATRSSRREASESEEPVISSEESDDDNDDQGEPAPVPSHKERQVRLKNAHAEKGATETDEEYTPRRPSNRAPSTPRRQTRQSGPVRPTSYTEVDTAPRSGAKRRRRAAPAVVIDKSSRLRQVDSPRHTRLRGDLSKASMGTLPSPSQRQTRANSKQAQAQEPKPVKRDRGRPRRNPEAQIEEAQDEDTEGAKKGRVTRAAGGVEDDTQRAVNRELARRRIANTVLDDR